MAYDRTQIKNLADANSFRAWLTQNEVDCRDSKGQHQIFQVKLSDSWSAISGIEKGEITTAPALRELIALYRKGASIKKPAPMQLPATAKTSQYLDDLRDDFAMAAMQAIITATVVQQQGGYDSGNMAAVASLAYWQADAMLAERAK